MLIEVYRSAKQQRVKQITLQKNTVKNYFSFKALQPYGIGVATGEACQNRVMFKQFLASGGMQFCQV